MQPVAHVVERRRLRRIQVPVLYWVLVSVAVTPTAVTITPPKVWGPGYHKDGGLAPKQEIFWRLMRSLVYLSPPPCFDKVSSIPVCCGRSFARAFRKAKGSLLPPPDWCFDAIYSEVLCCGKQMDFDDSVRNAIQDRRGGVEHDTANVASRANTSSVVAVSSPRFRLTKPSSVSCLLPWLPGAHTAEWFVDRFLQCDLGEALQMLGYLGDSLRNRCPTRRSVAHLRHVVLILHHRAIAEGSLQRSTHGWPLAFRSVLFALERCRSRLKNVPVVHLHAPKTAGSSLCRWANSSGHIIARYRESSCFLVGDGPSWIGDQATSRSCSQRSVEASQENISWMSVERWIDLPLCENFRYVATLREPITRLVSQFRHLLAYYMASGRQKEAFDTADLQHNFFGRLWQYDRVRKKLRKIGNYSADTMHWLDFWVGYASNYQVRSLAGPGVSAFLEDGSLAERRLEAAKANLEYFDAVLVVDQRLKQSWVEHSQLETLRRLLGPVSASLEFPKEHSVKHADVHGRMFWAPYVWSQGELLETRKRNLADTKLVAHARLLQRLDGEYHDLVR
eukprot:TRINITY_DN34066_c0_g1_i1.p1 TRINITY_DN34066_c0_g1~~TRINITY_DN34066_c0_g1_i1.p1  ORF type:complete len:562 (-),score=53.08 TRINITY_DN34066_c0_g1_i1:104-1789(-)